eukprot:5835121-Heterocapsa_arctica.AAC.1
MPIGVGGLGNHRPLGSHEVVQGHTHLDEESPEGIVARLEELRHGHLLRQQVPHRRQRQQVVEPVVALRQPGDWQRECRKGLLRL